MGFQGCGEDMSVTQRFGGDFDYLEAQAIPSSVLPAAITVYIKIN